MSDIHHAENGNFLCCVQQQFAQYYVLYMYVGSAYGVAYVRDTVGSHRQVYSVHVKIHCEDTLYLFRLNAFLHPWD